MAWTDPITWAVRQQLTAAMMNEQLRDNLNYLNSKTLAKVTQVANAPNQSTTSTSFVDVTNSSKTFTASVTGRALILVYINGRIVGDYGGFVTHQIVDGGGSLLGNQYPAARYTGKNEPDTTLALASIMSVTKDTEYTVKLQWKVNQATGYVTNFWYVIVELLGA